MEKSGFITCKTPFRVAGKRNPAKVEACSRRSVPPYGKRPLRKMEQSFFGGRIPRSHVRDKDARLFSDGDGANAASFCGSLNSLQYDFRRQQQRGGDEVHDLRRNREYRCIQGVFLRTEQENQWKDFSCRGNQKVRHLQCLAEWLECRSGMPEFSYPPGCSPELSLR